MPGYELKSEAVLYCTRKSLDFDLQTKCWLNSQIVFKSTQRNKEKGEPKKNIREKCYRLKFSFHFLV